MSDPMTNAEVEDVLSSIRRLVSDEKYAEPEPAPAAADRLVLTPALRVSEPEDQWPEPSEADTAEADTAEAGAPEDVPFMHRDVSVDATDEGSQRQWPGHDGSEVADTSAENEPDTETQALWLENRADDAVSDTREAEEEATQDQTDGHWPELDDEDEAESSFASQGEGSDSDVTVESLAAILRADEDDTHSPDENTSASDDSHAEVGAGTSEPMLDAQIEPEDPHHQGVADTADQSLSAKVAALETLLAGQANTWEPDEGDIAPQPSDPVAETLEWEDAVPDETAAFALGPEAEVDTETAPEEDLAVDAQSPFASQDSTAPEDLLDEDALRELISDIVRQELQGALGERITRNVRKLVRREIHRALAANELD